MNIAIMRLNKLTKEGLNMYPYPMSNSLRDTLTDLLSSQDMHLSEYDIFQRLRYFLHTKPELWDPETIDSMSLNDKVQVTIDMMADYFEENDLLDYMKLMNSPLMKKMREIEDRIDRK